MGIVRLLVRSGNGSVIGSWDCRRSADWFHGSSPFSSATGKNSRRNSAIFSAALDSTVIATPAADDSPPGD